jgi:hypothetical protein
MDVGIIEQDRRFNYCGNIPTINQLLETVQSKFLWILLEGLITNELFSVKRPPTPPSIIEVAEALLVG